MHRYYTIMLIPEHGKKVVSFRIPLLLFRATIFVLLIAAFFIVLLAYDYKQILNQVYENKYLVLENYKLREQLDVFQLKISTMASDLQRIAVFEKKLRVLTGMTMEAMPGREFRDTTIKNTTVKDMTVKDIEGKKEFIKLRELYHQQLAKDFGIPVDYFYTPTWSTMVKKGLMLAEQFALFDYEYNYYRDFSKELEKSVNDLDQFWLDRQSILKSTPSLLPSVGWLTSFYGVRQSPYSGRPKIHEGLDVGATIGTPIVASADGVITFAGHKPGLGKYVQIDHGHGLETVYAHANRLMVATGKKVKRGDLIAEVGNTGLSTGPHLHYEVRVNGMAVDPLYFVLD
ncbi:MAG: peptidoglycan DD-metalloendopeptidase family protein [Oligoflexia bacterium]|nr:peptidoglycan DD-metalloendopeptidase family protein [Oligoflexia bacterium]